MSDAAAMARLAQSFFDAIEAGDIDAMQDHFSPDAEIWHNTDEAIVSVPQTALVLSGMVSRIDAIQYAERRVTPFEGGFIQQHALIGRRKSDGGAVRLPCAILCRVEQGKITRLDEYFDSAHVAEFRK